MPRRRIRLTHHAMERSRERLPGPPQTRRAVKLPRSKSDRVGFDWTPKGYRVFCTSTAALLVAGRAVVTVLPLEPDTFADLLVWHLMGVWPAH